MGKTAIDVSLWSPNIPAEERTPVHRERQRQRQKDRVSPPFWVLELLLLALLLHLKPCGLHFSLCVSRIESSRHGGSVQNYLFPCLLSRCPHSESIPVLLRCLQCHPSSLCSSEAFWDPQLAEAIAPCRAFLCSLRHLP